MLKMMKLIFKYNKILLLSLFIIALLISLENGIFSQFGYFRNMIPSELYLLYIIIFIFSSMLSSYAYNINGSKKEFFTSIPIKSSTKLLAYLLLTIVFIALVYLMGAVSNIVYHTYRMKKLGIVIPLKDYLISFGNIKVRSSHTFEITDLLAFIVYATWFFMVCVTGINIYKRARKKIPYTCIYIFLLIVIFIINAFVGREITTYQSNTFNHYQPILALYGLLSLTKEWYSGMYIHYLPFINAVVSIILLFYVNIRLLKNTVNKELLYKSTKKLQKNHIGG